MSTYASLPDVQARVPEVTLSETSRPTLHEVSEMIDEAEGTVNGILTKVGYATVPAVLEGDIALLRGYVAKKVAVDVYLVALRGNDTPAKVKVWQEDWTTFLGRLRRGEQALAGQYASIDEPEFLIAATPVRDDLFSRELTDWI